MDSHDQQVTYCGAELLGHCLLLTCLATGFVWRAAWSVSVSKGGDAPSIITRAGLPGAIPASLLLSVRCHSRNQPQHLRRRGLDCCLRDGACLRSVEGKRAGGSSAANESRHLPL